jgi:hypothetical protein
MSDGYGLLLEFDNQSPKFAYGFECGRIWALLREYPASEIRETMHARNAEMILRMAEATGRIVTTEDAGPDHLEATFAPSATGGSDE